MKDAPGANDEGTFTIVLFGNEVEREELVALIAILDLEGTAAGLDHQPKDETDFGREFAWWRRLFAGQAGNIGLEAIQSLQNVEALPLGFIAAVNPWLSRRWIAVFATRWIL
ncbi:hypothetical protein AI27_02310 [Sphingomonas sp. BHC-A]|nr:hypothetical protein AI27_02310 [Sphingomonas sp. BHC-A]